MDAGRKLIQEIILSSRFFWRAPPKLSIEPILRKPKTIVSPTHSNETVRVVLPKISEFALKLGLPVKVPIGPDQIQRIEFVQFDSDVRVKLRNGYWFVCQKSVVSEFSAPDTVYGRQPAALDQSVRPFQEYMGKWRLTEKEAIALVYGAIENLGYTTEDFRANRPPDVIKPAQVGDYVVPRYSFRWLTNHPTTGGTIALLRAEVDADKKTLKYLELLSQKMFAATAKPDVPKELREQYENYQVIKFLDKAMPYATNGPPKRPSAKPESPYE